MGVGIIDPTSKEGNSDWSLVGKVWGETIVGWGLRWGGRNGLFSGRRYLTETGRIPLTRHSQKHRRRSGKLSVSRPLSWKPSTITTVKNMYPGSFPVLRVNTYVCKEVRIYNYYEGYRIIYTYNPVGWVVLRTRETQTKTKTALQYEESDSLTGRSSTLRNTLYFERKGLSTWSSKKSTVHFRYVYLSK